MIFWFSCYLITLGTVDTATGAFRRVHNQTEDEEDVTVVKGPMRGFDSRGDKLLQPTIAIITVHYFEKMAVDAVMTNKQTFVRYATVGRDWYKHIIPSFVLESDDITL